MKKILILGAGYYYKRVITLITGAGFHVLAVDRNRNAPGASLAHEFAPIDIIDGPAVVEWVKNKNIDGVMAVNDFGIRSAAFIASKLNLPQISTATAAVVSDKGLIRDAWQKAGLPQPDCRIVSSFEECESAALQIGFPCVLKPTDCGGAGRGVSVLKSPDDLEWAFDFARPFVANDRFILEQFLEGTEMTIEAITIDGTVNILAMSDKEKPDLRTRVATSLNYPAGFDEGTIREVRELVEKAVPAAGIDFGMSHTELIVTEEGPSLVEIGARGGGGHVFHTIIEAVSGVCAPVAAAQQLTSCAATLPQVVSNGAVYRFFNPPPGILKEVRNIDTAKAVDGVLDLDIVVSPGDTVGFLENSLQRAGFVVTAGKTRAEAVAVADRVESIIEFAVEPAHTTARA